METQKRTHLALLILLTIAAAFAGWLVWNAFRNPSVLVEWSTASELDTVGFNLYRGETESGPFQRVNSNLIPTSLDTLTGGGYSFRDKTVTAGRVYYYMLEDVASNGASNRHGPIEVRAVGAGVIEWVLVVVLGGFTLIGWVDWYFSNRRIAKAPNSQA